jgi:hypothetical protein
MAAGLSHGPAWRKHRLRLRRILTDWSWTGRRSARGTRPTRRRTVRATHDLRLVKLIFPTPDAQDKPACLYPCTGDTLAQAMIYAHGAAVPIDRLPCLAVRVCGIGVAAAVRAARLGGRGREPVVIDRSNECAAAQSPGDRQDREPVADRLSFRNVRPVHVRRNLAWLVIYLSSRNIHVLLSRAADSVSIIVI